MTTVIGIFAMGWWRRASMLYDVVIARERWHEDFYTTEKALKIGIELIKKRFFEIKTCTFDIGQVKFYLAPQGRDLQLYLVLRRDGQEVCAVACVLSCEQDVFLIKNYMICPRV
jgi:hypothetical protein